MQIFKNIPENPYPVTPANRGGAKYISTFKSKYVVTMKPFYSQKPHSSSESSKTHLQYNYKYSNNLFSCQDQRCPALREGGQGIGEGKKSGERVRIVNEWENFDGRVDNADDTPSENRRSAIWKIHTFTHLYTTIFCYADC